MVEDLPELRELVAEQLGTWEYTVWAIHAGQFDDLYQRFYAGGEVAEARQLPEDVWAVLDQAVIRNASDIHMSVGEQPAVRIDGSIVRLHTAPLTADWCREEFRRLAGEGRFETLEALNDVDFAITFGAARFRVNLGADRRGFTAALRKIPTKIPQIADLGLPPSLVDYVCGLDRGLVLVTGPTGSGKSTTNAALLAELAARYPKHILTLEDPVEYVLPSGRAMVHQRELGESFDSFDTGLRQALRQDPDVILVGELRDPETMETALHAAETGHLVFGTLHTVDAASTVARLVSSFPSDVQDHVRAQLAYILKAVVSQTLLPLRNAKGRVAAFEIMTSNPAIASNLRKVDGHVQLRQAIETARGEGMQTLEMHLAELVLAGTVAEDVAALKAPNLDDFHRRLAAE
ncbi:MAG: PilT/PilU family type 4a pilus ATPase [Actinomycetia bacterium]|nr:PilT/PilU family type 4a pilus ATPase [Actinomycetes bacterium]